MERKKYLTTLNTRPFLYPETKLVARLMQAGLTFEQIEHKVVEENLFDLESSDRAVRFFREIARRLEKLDIFLFNQFLASDQDTSKAVLLYALLKRDRLFYEWMREIVFEKFIVLDWFLTKEETRHFMEKKSKANETVRSWATETKDLLVDVYHRTLYEAGVAVNTEEETDIQRLVVYLPVRTYMIERKEKEIVELVLGELIG